MAKVLLEEVLGVLEGRDKGKEGGVISIPKEMNENCWLRHVCSIQNVGVTTSLRLHVPMYTENDDIQR